jgi:hypothetical protein
MSPQSIPGSPDRDWIQVLFEPSASEVSRHFYTITSIGSPNDSTAIVYDSLYGADTAPLKQRVQQVQAAKSLSGLDDVTVVWGSSDIQESSELAKRACGAYCMLNALLLSLHISPSRITVINELGLRIFIAGSYFLKFCLYSTIRFTHITDCVKRDRVPVQLKDILSFQPRFAEEINHDINFDY